MRTLYALLCFVLAFAVIGSTLWVLLSFVLCLGRAQTVGMGLQYVLFGE